MIKTALAKALTLKAAAAAVAATAAVGGVAYAANTGNLPMNLGGGHASATASADSSASGAEKGKGPGDAKGSPSPSLVGLCNAYQKGVAESKGKALENPAFKALITAADGVDNVAAYCDQLLAAKASAKATEGGRPSTAPSHEGGKPSTKPTEAGESAHPTARPTK